MFVNSLFERLDTVTLYFSYHSVWESVPYPNRRMKEGSVQCWCFSMRHGHSMIRHGWAGTSCSAGCVWIWQQCLEISRTVTGVHFIKHFIKHLLVISWFQRKKLSQSPEKWKNMKFHVQNIMESCPQLATIFNMPLWRLLDFKEL